jgi:hypothetical protein
MSNLPEVVESIPEISFDDYGRVILDGAPVAGQRYSDYLDVDESNGGCGCLQCTSNCGVDK